jgi:hypothetical protein
VLSTGGTASGTGTTAGTQAWDYTTASTSPIQQSSFIFGENVEKIARRSCLSGLNCTSAPIFLECNLSNAVTNSHTVYMQTMADVIYIVDFTSGEIAVRLYYKMKKQCLACSYIKWKFKMADCIWEMIARNAEIKK